MWNGSLRSRKPVGSWPSGGAITISYALIAPGGIARRRAWRRCIEIRGRGASLSSPRIGHSTARLKGSLRRQKPPLTRSVERPAVPLATKAKHLV